MNIGELAKFRAGIQADTIDEVTAASGVTIDSVLLKDGTVTATGTTGVVTNTITEASAGSGVSIDSVKLKDGGVDVSVTGTAKGQVKFPATQNASADANTLDDYSEIAWTPTLSSATGTVTTSLTYSYATKIGNTVFWTLSFACTESSSGGGALRATVPVPSPASSFSGSGIETQNTGKGLACIVNATYILIYFSDGTNPTGTASDRTYYCSGHYMI